MTTMNANETLLAYLSPLKVETFIRDSTGKIIGRFTPGGLTDEVFYARAHEFIDFEEAKRDQSSRTRHRSAHRRGDRATRSDGTEVMRYTVIPDDHRVEVLQISHA